MIRIRRSAEPKGHGTRCAAKLAELRAAVGANGGVPLRDYLADTYKHDDVREALWAMQHGKCAYCERDLEIAWEPVDHYRPVTRYWWLAYEWANLLLACSPCNSAGKADAFPLANELHRLAPEQLPPGGERPLLLDPTADHPERHLTFVREPNGDWLMVPNNRSKRGATTIRVCQLNRDKLARLRNKYAPQRIAVRDRYCDAIARNDDRTAAACLDDKQRMTADNQQFALLARVILAEVR